MSKSRLVVWRDMVLSPESGLRAAARLVACGLAKHMDSDGGSCWPSVELLAAETGLGRRSVQRGLRALEDAGWVSADRGGGRAFTSEYAAVFPTSERASERRVIDPEKGRQSDADSGHFDRKGVRDDTERASETTVKGVTVTPEDAQEDAQSEDVLSSSSANAPEEEGAGHVADAPPPTRPPALHELVAVATPASVAGALREDRQVRRDGPEVASSDPVARQERLATIKAEADRLAGRVVAYGRAALEGASPSAAHGLEHAVRGLDGLLDDARELAALDREDAA